MRPQLATEFHMLHFFFFRICPHEGSTILNLMEQKAFLADFKGSDFAMKWLFSCYLGDGYLIEECARVALDRILIPTARDSQTMDMYAIFTIDTKRWKPWMRIAFHQNGKYSEGEPTGDMVEIAASGAKQFIKEKFNEVQ